MGDKWKHAISERTRKFPASRELVEMIPCAWSLTILTGDWHTSQVGRQNAPLLSQEGFTHCRPDSRRWYLGQSICARVGRMNQSAKRGTKCSIPAREVGFGALLLDAGSDALPSAGGPGSCRGMRVGKKVVQTSGTKWAGHGSTAVLYEGTPCGEWHRLHRVRLNM